MKNNRGITIVELLIVIVVMGIISSFAVMMAGTIIENTKLGVDQQTIASLNTATDYYHFYSSESPIFDESLSNEEIITLLYTEGYLTQVAIAKSKDASFEWDSDTNLWHLNIGGTVISLSPYGDNYPEISAAIISDMQDRLADAGSYGRTWGDFKYSDIGLDPNDWNIPINHVIYTPSGSRLFLEPEDGYEFTVYNTEGDEFYMSSSYNWNIIYSDLDQTWYFHIISSENEIDINTLVITLQ